MDAFLLALILAAFACSLLAGFLFAFAVVVLPGIQKLDDGEFLRAFQVMDRVIQDNHPLFLLVWVGSGVALVGAAALGWGGLDLAGRSLLTAAVVVYLLGIQLPTAAIHLPLNNELQKLEIRRLNGTEQKRARERFEPRWNRWNVARTYGACLVCLLLLALLSRI